MRSAVIGFQSMLRPEPFDKLGTTPVEEPFPRFDELSAHSERR
jgi:hypothetical protein